MSTPEVKSSSDDTSRVFAGVDVGGTNIKLGIVDDDGRTLVRHSIPTEEERGPVDAMRRASDEIERMLEESNRQPSDLVAVGLATPGTMDIEAGLLLHPHNLPNWWDFPIRDCLREASGHPVWFANDANAAAFGEFWIGSGLEYRSIAFFTLGTGVGGGIIIGSLSVDGENSAGSELGHTIIDCTDTGRMCGCGHRGHLEAYASAKAVVKRTEEALDAGAESSLHDQRRQGPLTPLVVAQQAEAGDALARQIVMDTAMYLGIGAVNVMHTVDPGAVIFGGAMTFGGEQSALGQSFLDRIRQEVVSRAFPVLAKRTQIRFATLGGDAGYIGAAGIARAGVNQRSAH